MRITNLHQLVGMQLTGALTLFAASPSYGLERHDFEAPFLQKINIGGKPEFFFGDTAGTDREFSLCDMNISDGDDEFFHNGYNDWLVFTLEGEATDYQSTGRIPVTIEALLTLDQLAALHHASVVADILDDINETFGTI